ncbi:MAG: PPOX class F420-dependent oxidoreductase [Anaerolineae bacterium]|nr:PPOX class F420-dependent oxidoreductase [Anaerolineae bacterium]
MSLPITENFNDLFERKLLCAITTVNPDGQPHTVPVWCDLADGQARVNFPAATKKARNLQANNKLTLFILDPDNGGHWIEIQGHVGEVHEDADGGRDHINQLSQKYTGNPVYQDRGRPGDRRMYVIEATKINGN